MKKSVSNLPEQPETFEGALAIIAALSPSSDPPPDFDGGLLLQVAMLSLVAMSHHLGLLWVALEATTLSSAPLLYFNQIFGSLIKILVFFRLDRQRWTRQNTTLKASDTPLFDRFKRISSVYVTIVAVAVYLAALAVVSGVGAPQRTMPASIETAMGGLS